MLFFASCQDEAVEIINPDDQEAIVANSLLSNLMLRTSANAVSNDNILDNSSCFSVELPVTVIVGNITITIENEDGFDELEELLENFEDEVPDFVFPITIISADYTETMIENYDQLEALLDNCLDDDDVIECVDFVYPISFSVLNTEFVIIDTISIGSNEALYEFLDDLDDDNNNLVALNFPVDLAYASGETITVNSNTELSDAISAIDDDCDDDDCENCDVNEIKSSLKECVWEIDDEFNDFDDLYIDFYEDLSLKITGQDLQEPITGNWTVTQDDNGTYVVLSDLSGLEEDLEGEWLITECDDDELYITLNGLNLELDKDCNEAECNIEEVKDYLQTCIWNAVDVAGNEQLVDYDLDFQEEGVLVVTVPGAEPIIGTWSVVSLTEGIFLNIEGVNGPNIQAVNGYWKLYECDVDRLKFTNDNMYIILEQDCDANNPFECFDEQISTSLESCDYYGDGVAIFNIYEALPDCFGNNSISVGFYLSLEGAENQTNPLPNSTSFENTTSPQTVYIRITLLDNPDEFEIYPVDLITEDCTTPCSEEDVNTYLMDCIWNIVSFNGDDNLIAYDFDFNPDGNLFITNTSTNISEEANWLVFPSATTGQLILGFTNIDDNDLSDIFGNMGLISCDVDRLEFKKFGESSVVVMEQNCN